MGTKITKNFDFLVGIAEHCGREILPIFTKKFFIEDYEIIYRHLTFCEWITSVTKWMLNNSACHKRFSIVSFLVNCCILNLLSKRQDFNYHVICSITLWRIKFCVRVAFFGRKFINLFIYVYWGKVTRWSWMFMYIDI